MAKISDLTQYGGLVSLSLVANVGGTNFEGVSLGINFSNGVPISTGTYVEADSSFKYTVAGVYSSGNSMTITHGAGSRFPTAKPLSITILTKTATEMTGTFEGAFYRQDVSIPIIYDDYYLVTNGEFKLKIN